MNALSVPRLFMGPLPILAAGSASTSAAFRSAGSEAARADVPLPIDGTFSVNFTSTPTAPGIFSVVARGIGNTAHAGNLFFAVRKTVNFNDGTLQGTFTMTGENGDTLNGDYSGVVSPSDPKGFAPLSGQLTFTAGTGRFHNVKGAAPFTALVNLGTGQAVYSLSGAISFPGPGGQ